MNSSLELHVAIIGSGPSGFYAAAELLNQTNPVIFVDIFDRLPTPFGLVRGGVAPDHAKIKTVTKVYEKISAHPRFRFFGNVEFGKELFLKDLESIYGAVIFAVGAKSDRKMGIPGEDLKGSDPATIFVGWYNGHPDYKNYNFDLSAKRVAVVGNGNVAMDVTRILAVNPKNLQSSDIADYALEALKKSNVEEIFLLGRRGPAQAAFTNPEIRELCELEGADLVIEPKEINLDELSKKSLEQGSGGLTAKNNVQILQEQSQKPIKNQPKKIIVKFLVSPVELIGKDGKVTEIKLEKNKLYLEKDGSLRPKGTGEYETLPIDLVFRSVGYKGVPLTDLPFDPKSGAIPNEKGRVMELENKKIIPGLYVVGWAKRGPSGVIGTNKPDSIETAHKLLEDFSIYKGNNRQSQQEKILDLLKERKIDFVTYEDWKTLDLAEIEQGKKKGKEREKYTTIPEMLSAIKKNKIQSLP
ncbi:MAG: FAD-dependent oxidoreductase [Elusimicrobia bacterium]|nr:FAD-dependent oxidoreductase [Elusimicrobiota bacterium]